jgi:Ca2+-binding RTX toxin-like protein
MKQSYSGNGYSLSFDSSYSSNYSSDANGDITTDIKTTTFKSYTYTDSVHDFSLKASGTDTIDNVKNMETVAFNTVECNDVYYKITATNVNFSRNALKDDATPIESLLNFGVTENDDISLVYLGLGTLDPIGSSSNSNINNDLLAAIINSDNVVTLKSNGLLVNEISTNGPLQGLSFASDFNAGSGNDLVRGTVYNDRIMGDSGNDSILGGLGNDWISTGTGSDKLSGGLGSDTFAFDLGDSGQTSNNIDQILDFSKGKVGKGDVIRLDGELVIGGSVDTADLDNASIDQITGMAIFALGSGKTFNDALHDIATGFSSQNDQAGQFAFFKVSNAGSYYLFVSDGETGVTSNDLVVQLVGVTSINTIDTMDGLRVLN